MTRFSDRRVVLIGMRGSGKSTVGKALANRIFARFLDTDDLVVAKAKKSIFEIFEHEGEQEFRQKERRALTLAAKQHGPVVMATGGGVVLDPDNREILKKAGMVVFLRAPCHVLVKRLAKDERVRPSLIPGLSLEKELCELLLMREPLYLDVAHVVVDASFPVDHVVGKLEHLVHEDRGK